MCHHHNNDWYIFIYILIPSLFCFDLHTFSFLALWTRTLDLNKAADSGFQALQNEKERQWKFSWSSDPAQEWAAISQSVSFFLSRASTCGHLATIYYNTKYEIQNTQSKIWDRSSRKSFSQRIHFSWSFYHWSKTPKGGFASWVITPLFHIKNIILVLEHGNNIFPKLYWTFVKFHQSWSFPAKFTTII